jgi:hypothetical protein
MLLLMIRGIEFSRLLIQISLRFETKCFEQRFRISSERATRSCLKKEKLMKSFSLPCFKRTSQKSSYLHNFSRINKTKYILVYLDVMKCTLNLLYTVAYLCSYHHSLIYCYPSSSRIYIHYVYKSRMNNLQYRNTLIFYF